MSLKAKIEAVIYAAEEPVTLAQLAGLFSEEALEEKREREAAVAAQQEELRPEPEGVVGAENISPDDGVVPVEPADAIPEETQPLPDEEPEQASTEETTTASASPEDEKKAARQRDREVREELRRIVDELIKEYAESDRGMEIREIAGGYRVGTKPEYHDAVRSFVKSLKPPMKLSLQALETLAVIAYKQPITAPEVSEIRGVDSAGVIGSLITRKLITTAGRKQVIGRPILYKTTKEFLLRFGLSDLNELPSLEEFEKMAAGELSETEELPFQEQGEAAEHPVVDAGEAETDDEESEAEEAARAQAAVEITDETAEETADFPGVAVEIAEADVEIEETEVVSEAATEREP